MKKWKSFSDWRLRTKLFFILALCLVVSMLLSVYNMFHISRAYDRELYGALSNFCRFPSPRSAISSITCSR